MDISRRRFLEACAAGGGALSFFLSPILGSVPAMRRAMLPLWRQKISAAMRTVNVTSYQVKPATSAISGAIAAAHSAASDENRNIVATASQVMPDTKPRGQMPAKSTPKKVATPFPPLKPSHTG